jgi:hypothetical protein
MAINLNIKQQVLRDRGSLFSVKSLRIDRLRQLLRLNPKSAAKV